MKIFILLLIMIVVLTSCTPYKINASRAHLFTKNCEIESKDSNCQLFQISKSDKNEFPYFSGNPVFVSHDSKFSIELKEIRPPLLSYYTTFDSSYKLIDDIGETIFRKKYGPLSSKEIEYNTRNKQLWLLTTIRSQSVDDPLEANSKTYVKSTQVKWDSGSHLLVPLDKKEKIVFTHDADSSYRILFQLMEVNSLEVKKQLAILRNQTGLTNLVETGYRTVLELFNTAVGKDLILDKIDGILKNDTAFQRFLLSIGATVEFVGEFTVLRKDKSFSEEFSSKLVKNEEFYLIDGFRKKAANKKGANELSWNDGINNNISINADDGAIIKNSNSKVSKDSKDSGAIKYETNDLDNKNFDAGYISFNIAQIPNRQTITGSLDSNETNLYYTYTKINHYLNRSNEILFDTILNDCYRKDPEDIEETKKDNKARIKKNNKCNYKKWIFGMTKTLPDNTQGINSNNEQKTDSLIDTEVFNLDFINYYELESKYNTLGKTLRCHDIYIDITNKNTEEEYIKAFNSYCSPTKLYSKSSDAYIQNSDNKKIISKRLRSEKNAMYEELKALKDFIIKKMFKNVIRLCDNPKVKESIQLKIDEATYSCELFSQLQSKENEFIQFQNLYQRIND